ncbi:MAG: response regulator transcription factor [Planctomycetota bacterium]|jgi:DNA-binding NarL/FixJ family response regulator
MMANKIIEDVEQKKRILIVEDHPIVRQGLRWLIGQEPDLEICGEVEDVPGALRLVNSTCPDLVVIDISLKNSNGIELVKQIKDLDIRVRMLVSSVHDDSVYAERALRAGAMGYINKQQATDKLIQAIRTVLDDRVYLSEYMADRLLDRFRRGKGAKHSLIDSLSDRELEVFELLGQGLSVRQIADKLHRSPKTVESHRENIKTKLNLDSGTELLYRAIEWVKGSK